MSLTEYKNKRTLSKTPEPAGGKPASDKLTFVIQKHAASHLHYDFRLEVRGVLKSWAIPKGPSMNPAIPHLAMMVEDHPFDYKDFEGIIPPGNYGAGTVIIWDKGTYEPVGNFKTKAEQEKQMLKNIYGKKPLKIKMNGKKVKGLFALIPTTQRGKTSWLLVKDRDKYATEKEITLKDKSVVSNKTIEQISKDRKAKKWISNRNANEKKPIKKNEPVAAIDFTLLKYGKKSKFPTGINPMLCTKITEPFNNPDWVYEVKWDGFRIVAHLKNGKVTLHSRSLLDYTKKYPPIASALQEINAEAIFDGEIIVLNSEGRPDFDALQDYQSSPAGKNLVYYVFDLLYLNGYNLINVSLTDRKELLKQLVPDNGIIKYSEHFEDGIALYKQTQEIGLEGIVAKNRNSIYQPGIRSKEWLKLPTAIHREFVIGGWTESDKQKYFRALLFGEYQNGKLVWIGHAGGGFKHKDMPVIFKN